MAVDYLSFYNEKIDDSLYLISKNYTDLFVNNKTLRIIKIHAISHSDILFISRIFKSSNQRKHQRIFKILSQALKRAFSMHYEFSNCLLNDQNWIEMLTSILIKDNINSDNLEQCHRVYIEVIKILCKSFFSFQMSYRVFYMNQKTMN